MSSSSSATTTDYVKPLTAAATAFALDKFVLQNPNMMSSAYFGASVGAALFAVKMVEVNVPAFLPDIPSIGATGKTLSDRVAEIAGGVGLSYAISKFVAKDTSSPQVIMKRMAVVVAADLAGEYASDYANSRPLSYFS